MTVGYSRTNISEKLRGKNLPDQKNVIKRLKEHYDTEKLSSMKAKSKVADMLKYKGESERKRIYGRLNLSYRARRELEKRIEGGQISKHEQAELEKQKIEQERRLARSSAVARDELEAKSKGAQLIATRAKGKKGSVDKVLREGDRKIYSKDIGVKAQAGVVAALASPGVHAAGDAPAHSASVVEREAAASVAGGFGAVKKSVNKESVNNNKPVGGPPPSTGGGRGARPIGM